MSAYPRRPLTLTALRAQKTVRKQVARLEPLSSSSSRTLMKDRSVDYSTVWPMLTDRLF